MAAARPDGAEPGRGEKRFLPRWVLWLALAGAAGPIAILGFVLFTEDAHDAGRCPFVEIERREIAPALVVVESARSCVPDIEERRWALERDRRSRVLGNRRLDRAAFAPERYRWTTELSEAGEVRITVVNDGHGQVFFREGTPEERARDGR